MIVTNDKSDDDSTGSDTLLNSEESGDEETMVGQLTPPAKMVTFDLLESTAELMDKFTDETEEQVNE